MKKKTKKNYLELIKMEYKEHGSSFVVFSILRIAIIVVMVHQIFLGQYENVYLYLLTLLLLYVPSFLQVQLKVELPALLEIIIYCFIFAAEILGTINSFYEKIPYWDVMLHTLNGFLAAAIGFSLIWLLNRSEKQKIELSPLYLCVVAFCFSMTIGVLWEFLEFGMDAFWGFDHQRDTIINTLHSRLLDSNIFGEEKRITEIYDVTVNGQSLKLNGYLDIGLIDTMKDLFVNFIGALIFSVFGYFYAKNDENKFIEQFMPKDKENESDLID